jgi:hypothetical protein
MQWARRTLNLKNGSGRWDARTAKRAANEMREFKVWNAIGKAFG